MLHACRLAALAVGMLVLSVAFAPGAPAAPGQPGRQSAEPGASLDFTATAYCQAGITQSGVGTHVGIAAADPEKLPVGSVVLVETEKGIHDGIYTILDTGSKVQGYIVDLFMRSCSKAREFGRQAVRVTVLRRGWNPKDTAPADAIVDATARGGGGH